MPRIKPRAAGRESSNLPLCYAAPFEVCKYTKFVFFAKVRTQSDFAKKKFAHVAAKKRNVVVKLGDTKIGIFFFFHLVKSHLCIQDVRPSLKAAAT